MQWIQIKRIIIKLLNFQSCVVQNVCVINFRTAITDGSAGTSGVDTDWTPGQTNVRSVMGKTSRGGVLFKTFRHSNYSTDPSQRSCVYLNKLSITWTAWHGTIGWTVDNELKTRKEAVLSRLKVLTRHLPGRCEETHGPHHSEYPVSRPWFELGEVTDTSQEEINNFILT